VYTYHEKGIDMDFVTIIGLTFGHWFADFVLQSRRIAESKSSSLKSLFTHVALYTAALACVMVPILIQKHDLRLVLAFIVINGLCHLVTDFATSKMSAHAWKQEDKSNFWNIIGFDQSLHWSHLLITYFGFFVWGN
jgi:hypothetical protein